MKHEFYYDLDSKGVFLYLNQINKGFLKKKKVLIEFPNWKNFNDMRMHEALGFLRNIEQNEDGNVKVLNDGSGLFISHYIISKLSSFQTEILGLPPTFPYNFKIQTQDSMQSKNFKIYWDLKHRGSSVNIDERIGSIIKIGSKYFRLSDPYFKIAEHLDNFENIDKNNYEKVLEFVSELKNNILPKELSESIQLDNQIQNIELKHAHGFSVQVTGDMNQLNFNTILFGKDIKNKVDEDGNLIEEDEQLLSEHQARQFAGNFKKNDDVSKTYLLGTNQYVYLEPNLRKVLKVVNKISKSDKETRKKFLKNPKSVIREVLDDEIKTDNSELAEIKLKELENIFIETSQFSDRVLGLGIWEKKELGYLQRQPQEWFDDNFCFLSDGQIIIVPKDKVEECLKVIEKALDEGKTKITFLGQTFEITKILLDELKQRVKEKPSKKSGDPSEGKGEGPKQKNLFAVLTKENFEEVEYFPQLKKRKIKINDTYPKLLNEKIKLHKHQKEGVEWLSNAYNKGLSGVLMADDMGLGKTLQALSFLSILKKSNIKSEGPFLIVAPVGLLKNWEEEHNKHLEEPGLGKLMRVYGLNLRDLKEFKGKDIDLGMAVLNINKIKKADWVLTTYETLRDYQASFAQVKFSCAIFDEMQKVKNPKSHITTGATAVNSDFIIGLTGTPVENTMSDLWQIMDIVMPGYLGELKAFVHLYKDNDYEQLKKLALKLTKPKIIGIPLILRRLKKNMMKDALPNKKIIEISETTELMPELQEKHYQDIVQQKNLGNFSGLKALQNMRQSSLVPYEPSQASVYGFEKYINSSARMKVLFRELDKIFKKKKSFNFLERRDLQPIVASMIQDKYNLENQPLIINGEISGDARQKRVNIFQNSNENNFNAMIISPKAGGVGITLTAANNVIHLERWWNPADEDQCTDRAYRIGQKKDVSVYIPIARSKTSGDMSFDLILHKLLTEKRQMAEGVFMPTSIGGDGSGFSGAFEEAKGEKINLDDIDVMEGVPFEDFLFQRVNSIKDLLCTKTQRSYDYGADLVIKSERNNRIAIIQCKHRSSKVVKIQEKVISDELLKAKNSYSYENPILILVSNVLEVTSGCKKAAEKFGVKLLLRNKLENFDNEIQKIIFGN